MQNYTYIKAIDRRGKSRASFRLLKPHLVHQCMICESNHSTGHILPLVGKPVISGILHKTILDLVYCSSFPHMSRCWINMTT